MIKLGLIWVGKTKERFVVEGLGKYLKLLEPYADVGVTEVREEKGDDIQRIVEKEGERILKLKVPFVLLDETGKNLTSVEFAGLIGKLSPRINFVLGGPFGVSARVKGSAADVIALSRMTLTHDMARLLLVEQAYRAFTIISRKGYHH